MPTRLRVNVRTCRREFASAYTSDVRRGVAAAATLLYLSALGTGAQEIDYAKVWTAASTFDVFLASVRAREEQWKSRFANAAIEPDALTRTRALKEKRRILVITEDRCSDSAWTVPFIAKLAAAVPERLELRLLSREEWSNRRVATPTVIVLDEHNRPLGRWGERPSELQAWVTTNRASMSSDELHRKMDEWYAQDAGRSTVQEMVELLEKQTAERK